MEVGDQHHDPAALSPGKTRYSFVQEAGWAPGPVWTGAEKSRLHRDSTPGPFSLQRVAILTVLCRSTADPQRSFKIHTKFSTLWKQVSFVQEQSSYSTVSKLLAVVYVPLLKSEHISRFPPNMVQACDTFGGQSNTLPLSFIQSMIPTGWERWTTTTQVTPNIAFGKMHSTRCIRIFG